MIMKMFVLAGSTALLTLATCTATEAVTLIGVGDVVYKVTFITGSFQNNSSLLTSQPWFNSPRAASRAAKQVGLRLGIHKKLDPIGTDNNNVAVYFAPLFLFGSGTVERSFASSLSVPTDDEPFLDSVLARQRVTNTVNSLLGRKADFFVPIQQRYGSLDDCCTLLENQGFSPVETYAVATAIPEPLTILGSLAALGLGGAMKRKLSSKIQGLKPE